MLRTIPNFITFRPADINEIMGSWEYILKNNCPTALVISKEERSKQKIPMRNLLSMVLIWFEKKNII